MLATWPPSLDGVSRTYTLVQKPFRELPIGAWFQANEDPKPHASQIYVKTSAILDTFFNCVRSGSGVNCGAAQDLVVRTPE